jgi:hypothetical protein
MAQGAAAPSYCVARIDRAVQELGFRAEVSVTRHLTAELAEVR